MVVEFRCPEWHRTADRRQIASVWLVVEDDGWVSLDEASPCPHCTAESLERWLLTCARCEAGEDSTEHPAGDEYHRGDTSPFSVVDNLFWKQEVLTIARWWDEQPEQASAGFANFILRRISGEITSAEWSHWDTESDWMDDLPDSFMERGHLMTPDDVEPLRREMVRTARQLLGQSELVALRVRTARPAFTDETAVAWLDQQTNPEGAPLIPATVSQREAWSVAQHISGHPPKNVVERAQTIRKNGQGNDSR